MDIRELRAASQMAMQQHHYKEGKLEYVEVNPKYVKWLEDELLRRVNSGVIGSQIEAVLGIRLGEIDEE